MSSTTACPQVPPSLTREFYAALCGRSKGRDVPVIFERPLADIQAALKAITGTLAAHTAALTRIQTTQEKIMTALSDLQAADTALQAKVGTVLADFATALTNAGTDPAAIEQVVTDMNAMSATLAAADPAATPATPPAAATSANPGIGN